MWRQRDKEIEENRDRQTDRQRQTETDRVGTDRQTDRDKIPCTMSGTVDILTASIKFLTPLSPEH